MSPRSVLASLPAATVSDAIAQILATYSQVESANYIKDPGYAET